MTYYLKYRPQTISALDLNSVRRELGGILSSGRFAHAYLFAGPRGTGKTSAARIIAKLVNCERNKNLRSSPKKSAKLFEPCNKCNLCRAVTDGTALDLFEIDAASNRGIDDIRELRERIKLAPTQAWYKVYIIDEVQMLTTEAFNALLKTLEEPPAHALFVLCTTTPEKLPETVVSRCTRIDFHKASPEEVVSSLGKVVKGEKLPVGKGVLEAIAKLVDGSFRDGMKILEQLSLRLSKKKGRGRVITVSDVEEVASLTGAGAARHLLTFIADGDVRGAFLFVDEIVKKQASQEQFVREILELLRRLMLTEVGVIKEERIEGLSLTDIRRLIVLFNRAAYGLRSALIPELPLELALVGWFEDMSESSPSHKASHSAEATRDKSEGRGKSKRGKIYNKSISTKSTNEQKSFNKPMVGDKRGVTFSKVKESWPRVLQLLRPQNHSLEALLKAAEPKELDGELLTLEVAYPFHKEQLELVRHRSLVESAVYKVFSEKLKLRYILRGESRGNPTTRQEDENISSPVEDEEIIRFAEEVFGTKSE